jgi:effector-binding domain-containing protein
MSDLEPEIVELEAQEALAVRGDVPVAAMPDFFGRAFPAVWAAAQAGGVDIVGPPFGYYPSPPTDTVVVEAGAPVSAPAPDSGEVHRLVLPGGRAVVATHVGPYDTLATTYADLQAWMRAERLVPAGPVWESYLSDPAAEPDPSTWRTRIVWPVR